MNGPNITTTRGETFTYQDSCNLARLILIRFGYDTAAAHAAWCRMLENNCSQQQYAELANHGDVRTRADEDGYVRLFGR